jgi:hypothetical protein
MQNSHYPNYSSLSGAPPGHFHPSSGYYGNICKLSALIGRPGMPPPQGMMIPPMPSHMGPPPSVAPMPPPPIRPPVPSITPSTLNNDVIPDPTFLKVVESYQPKVSSQHRYYNPPIVQHGTNRGHNEGSGNAIL